jgi:hypothetical protein
MTERFTEERITIELVKTGYSLAFNQGRGRQLFQVEKMTVSGGQDANGNYFQKITLESEPLQSTGEPWVIDFEPGSMVTRIKRA